MKTKQDILDYLKRRKEFFENQIEWCNANTSNLKLSSIDYRAYKWLKSDYETRLDVINDLLYRFFVKEGSK